MRMKGRCVCGAVRFTADEVETSHHACHCATCRRWSGGPLLATFAGRVELEGADDLAVYASSDWAERGFCRLCGSNLFYRLKASGQHFMMVGAFDDPSAFTLTREIFIDRKPGGYAFAGEHERWTGEETFARLA